MNELVFNAADEAATDRLGTALAAVLPPGSVVALHGTLGAGKTRLVQAIAAASGVERADVVSPTFVLCAKYQGTSRTIYHLDAYRLRDEDEFRELGIDELLASDDLTIIEWADNVAGCLPDERLEIAIEVTGPTERRFVIRALDTSLTAVIDQLAAELAESP